MKETNHFEEIWRQGLNSTFTASQYYQGWSGVHSSYAYDLTGEIGEFESKLIEIFATLSEKGEGYLYHNPAGSSTVTRMYELRGNLFSLSLLIDVKCETPFRLQGTTIDKNSIRQNKHKLETRDPNMMYSFICTVISSVDPERGKWIKL